MGELHNKMFRCFWSQTAFSSGCWTFWLLEFMINIHSPPPCFLWAIHRRQRIITPRIGCGFQSKFKFFFLSLCSYVLCVITACILILSTCAQPQMSAPVLSIIEVWVMGRCVPSYVDFWKEAMDVESQRQRQNPKPLLLWGFTCFLPSNKQANKRKTRWTNLSWKEICSNPSLINPQRFLCSHVRWEFHSTSPIDQEHISFFSW